MQNKSVMQHSKTRAHMMTVSESIEDQEESSREVIYTIIDL
jgi:hypothetical protein